MLGAIPRVDQQSERLTAIKGGVPDPVSPPPGCRFHPRCPFADETCARTQPDLRAIAPGHDVACLKAPP